LEPEQECVSPLANSLMKLDELFPVTPAVPRPARGRPSRLTIRRIPKAGRSCPRSP